MYALGGARQPEVGGVDASSLPTRRAFGIVTESQKGEIVPASLALLRPRWNPLAVLFQHFDRVTVRVVDGNFQRHLAWK